MVLQGMQWPRDIKIDQSTACSRHASLQRSALQYSCTLCHGMCVKGCNLWLDTRNETYLLTVVDSVSAFSPLSSCHNGKAIEDESYAAVTPVPLICDSMDSGDIQAQQWYRNGIESIDIGRCSSISQCQGLHVGMYT